MPHPLPDVTPVITYPQLGWIPLLPLLAAAILLCLGRYFGSRSSWLAIGALVSSCFLSLSIGPRIFEGKKLAIQWAWLSTHDPQWTIGLSVDGMSWMMLCIVSVIGSLIMVYSIGYMHGDPRFGRFFAYLSLFCASMLTLVMADHFLLLFACWELVGVCSYLLISFWFEKSVAAAAGRKAFITTRIGDTALLIGIFLLAVVAGDLHLSNLGAIRGQLLQGHPGLLTLIGTLIFFGAVGKSAQIPLHVWLPDAMEGPTSVSALIHAATMVAAGVYLVARTLPLFTPFSLQIVLVIGLLTHLLAGTVALTMTDIKRVLAYSTISQLGLMMTALGLGALSAAMFHLFTHAFFKALLFLAAGSVIHATHHQDMSQLGGLSKRLPLTWAVFLVAALSMGGFPLLSGFWSKDAILLAASQKAPWLMWVLLGGAVMTAAYTFRLFLRCFHGKSAHSSPSHSSQHEVHESPAIMLVPMGVLAFGAAFVGLVGSPWLHSPLFHLLGVTEAHEELNLPILFASTAALFLGFWLALQVGLLRKNLLPVSLRPLGLWFYRLAFNKYYVDETYQYLVVGPFLRTTEQLAIFDQKIIDAAVNGAGRIGAGLSVWKERFDRHVVDGLVNGIAQAWRTLGASLRGLQTGIVHHYLLIVVVSVVLFSLLLRL